MATPELCKVLAAGLVAGGTPFFSASLGSLLWVFWWGGEHKDSYI